MSRPKIIIITPVYHAQVGGAAIYYQRLAGEMRAAGVDVVVISDRSGATDEAGYYGLFPAWASRERRFARDLLSYGLQNLLYFRLGGIIRRERPDAVFVHTSFHNHPGIFGPVMSGLVRRFPAVRFIADTRDRLLAKSKVPVLNAYHAIIACSLNVHAHLAGCGADPARLVHIPVLQERIEVADAAVDAARERYGLKGRDYLVYVGAIKEDKAVDVLLAAFTGTIARGHPELLLVLVGPVKTSRREIPRMMEHAQVAHLGRLDRNEVLAVMKGARLCVNLSPNEGMPRASLEALALGRPVVLPPNVPEFARYCPEDVVPASEVEAVASFMADRLAATPGSCYPIGEHYPDRLLARYLEVAGLPAG